MEKANKKVHLSIMGGMPVKNGAEKTATSGDGKKGGLERETKTIYDVLREDIKNEHGDRLVHVSMLPEIGTYKSNGEIETIENISSIESAAGHKNTLDHNSGRFDTNEAVYSEWEDNFKGKFYENYLKPETEGQEVDLTVDTWSLGTAFFVKFLSNPENLQFLKDKKINVKGVHFIAPVMGLDTSFSLAEINPQGLKVVQEFIASIKQDLNAEIFITANKHDQILPAEGGGTGTDNAIGLASIIGHELNGAEDIEEHNEADIDFNIGRLFTSHEEGGYSKEEKDKHGAKFFGSHYVTSHPEAIRKATERTKRMISKNLNG